MRNFLRKTPLVAVLIAMGLLAGACAGSGVTNKSPAKQAPTGTTMEPGIYEVASGDRITPDTFFEAVAERTYIVVGEQHDRPWHHEVQASVFNAVLERHENPVAIGMEMFQHPYQAALTAYASGAIDEPEMLERTEYESRWGFDTAFYSPLWRAARQNGYPIVALNAPRELSRKIAELGVDGLPEQQRETLPAMDMKNDIHREYVRRAFAAHGMGMDDAKFERFYQAQVLWDETMAQTAVQFMQSHPHVEAMMIVAGIAHADERFGIPPRIQRRIDHTDVLTLRPVHQDELRHGETSLEEIRDEGRFDYIWVGGN